LSGKPPLTLFNCHNFNEIKFAKRPLENKKIEVQGIDLCLIPGPGKAGQANPESRDGIESKKFDPGWVGSIFCFSGRAGSGQLSLVWI